jgi:hypothetical protein
MPTPLKPDKNKKNFNLDDLTIGDRILANLHHGRTEEAVIKAIIPDGDGKKFQIDYGHDETALIEDWQVIGQLR